MGDMRPEELKRIPQSTIEIFKKLRSYDKEECTKGISAILDELLKCGIRTRSEEELKTLVSFLTPNRPGPPLVSVGPNDIAPGSVIRVWHDMLNQWATGWLEVLFVVDDMIGMRDAAGGYTVRSISDTARYSWRHPDFGPARLLATMAEATDKGKAKKEAKPILTTGTRVAVKKAGRWGRCEACGAYVELPNAKEVVWDWDGVDAHAYYCHNCYAPNNIYMGRLTGADSQPIIDQICQ